MNQMTTNTRVVLLDTSTASKVGDGVSRSNYDKHFIQSVSEASIIVTISVSGDGTNWVDLTPTITGNGYIVLDGYYPFIRASRNAVAGRVITTIYSSGFEA